MKKIGNEIPQEYTFNLGLHHGLRPTVRVLFLYSLQTCNPSVKQVRVRDLLSPTWLLVTKVLVRQAALIGHGNKTFSRAG